MPCTCPEGEAERCLRPPAAHSRPAHSALFSLHNPAALSTPDRRERRELGHAALTLTCTRTRTRTRTRSPHLT